MGSCVTGVCAWAVFIVTGLVLARVPDVEPLLLLRGGAGPATSLNSSSSSSSSARADERRWREEEEEEESRGECSAVESPVSLASVSNCCSPGALEVTRGGKGGEGMAVVVRRHGSGGA